MIQVAPGTKVYLGCRPVSMRYGFDGLAAQSRTCCRLILSPGICSCFVVSEHSAFHNAIPWSDSGQPDEVIVLIILVDLWPSLDYALHPYPHGFGSQSLHRDQPLRALHGLGRR